ncbi:MAG: hypothetical protein KGH71_04440 [Candidatus Micrarchaeota archaeon]|nr:hypothetical protein [Candidatus Micrarchaeota archaeon]
MLKTTIEKEEGFLLLKPMTLENTGKIAKAIAMCKGVKEVFLTSGEYGFVAVVKARGMDILKVRNLAKQKGKFRKISVVVKHQKYKTGK